MVRFRLFLIAKGVFTRFCPRAPISSRLFCGSQRKKDRFSRLCTTESPSDVVVCAVICLLDFPTNRDAFAWAMYGEALRDLFLSCLVRLVCDIVPTYPGMQGMPVSKYPANPGMPVSKYPAIYRMPRNHAVKIQKNTCTLYLLFLTIFENLV